MFTIRTIIQQVINAKFGRITKIKSVIWIKAGHSSLIYKVILKDTEEERLVFIPYNADKPFSLPFTNLVIK